MKGLLSRLPKKSGGEDENIYPRNKRVSVYWKRPKFYICVLARYAPSRRKKYIIHLSHWMFQGSLQCTYFVIVWRTCSRSWASRRKNPSFTFLGEGNASVEVDCFIILTLLKSPLSFTTSYFRYEIANF